MLTAPGTVSPPRVVSLRDKFTLFFSTPIVFVSYFVYFIAFFIGLVFLGLQDTTSQYFRDDHPRIQAAITEVVYFPGSRSMGGRSTPSSHEYHYQYVVNGTAYKGSVIDRKEIGTDAVTVQYVPEQPHLSRVDGLGSAGMPAWALLFPLIVLGLALRMSYHGYREMQATARLIAHGVIGEASAVCTANNEIHLRFTTASGETYDVPPDFETGKLGLGRRTDVVYLPDQPGVAVRLQGMAPKARAMLLAYAGPA